MTFSAIYVVRNEEEHLEESLKVIAQYTSDIVVFDTESNDNTKEIASKYTDKLISVPYVGYCDCYKESAMLRTKYDWNMFVYPDEEWSKDVLKWLSNLPEPKEHGIAFLRDNYLDGKQIYDGLELSEHTRVFRKGQFYLGDLVDGELYNSDVITCPFRLTHRKSSRDMIIDIENRKIACETLTYKYRLTHLSPYKQYADAYRKWLDDYTFK